MPGDDRSKERFVKVERCRHVTALCVLPEEGSVLEEEGSLEEKELSLEGVFQSGLKSRRVNITPEALD